MVCVPLPAPPNSTPSTLILAAARCWRRTQDSGRPVQAALFRTLDAYRCGMLAPAFASLLALYESCLGRQIRVGGPHPRLLSADEQQLLGLLNRAGGEAARISEFADGSGLAGAMRVAVRSTRIQLRRAPDAVGGQSLAQRRPKAEAPNPRPETTRRNRPLAASVDALRGAYPVTAKILGKTGFQAAARAFARRHATDGPLDAGYGRDFAPFLAEQLRISDQLYLADVAMLERLRTEALLAATAPVLELGEVARFDEAGRANLRLELHPAAGLAWLTSPAVTIWHAHQQGAGMPPADWRAEGALVTRPNGQVALRHIGRPEHRMLSGLRLRETVGEAAAATRALYPEADADLIFAELVDSGAFREAVLAADGLDGPGTRRRL